MKIIVDKVPDIPSECLFSEYSGSGLHECKLDGSNCPMCYNRKCDKLVEIGDLALLRPQENLNG